MTVTVDYYMTLNSPWTYLGSALLAEIAGRNNVTINIKPCKFGPIFEQTGGLPLPKRSPQRRAYRMMELKRWREVRGIPVSVGNPHYVVFVNEFGPGWQAEAAEIGRHHDFKYGINVEFVVGKDKTNVEARFFERGVGETQSSGTGSCASAVAAITAKRAESPVRVHTPGGVQTVRWEDQVFLRGPAQLIGRGEFFV